MSTPRNKNTAAVFPFFVKMANTPDAAKINQKDIWLAYANMGPSRRPGTLPIMAASKGTLYNPHNRPVMKNKRPNQKPDREKKYTERKAKAIPKLHRGTTIRLFHFPETKPDKKQPAPVPTAAAVSTNPV
jgi:hypothetical protein